MDFLIKTVITLCTLYSSSVVISLYQNYRSACAIGLPIVISPLNPDSSIWMVLGGLVAPYLRNLPGPFKVCGCILYIGWQYDDVRKPAKEQMHRRFGTTFLIVSPGGLAVVTSDPAIVRDVLKRVNDFPKPDLYETLDIYGSNVNTTNGKNWARQRKLTAPCFNENFSSLVWGESHSQVKQILDEWLASAAPPSNTIIEDSRTIALNVLLSAAFDIDRDSGGVRDIVPGFTMTYAQALMGVLQHIVLVSLLYSTLKLPRLSFLPREWQHALTAAKELELQMRRMLREQDALLRSGTGQTKPNLATALLKSSIDNFEEEQGIGGHALSEKERMGNLFIFNLAGHDTTANTLAYSIALLAAYPEWQEYLREELMDVFADGGDLKYDTGFPQLKRCRAIMYETLRLYGPVTYIPRVVKLQPQEIKTPISDINYVLPTGTNVMLNLQALHTSEGTWGSDSMDFNPRRWIETLSKDGQHGTEELIDRGDNFVAWASGPRVCPGLKFAQVEIVAVLSSLFLNAEVIAFDEQLDQQEATKKLQRVIGNSGFTGPTLGILRPREVKLRWKLLKP